MLITVKVIPPPTRNAHKQTSLFSQRGNEKPGILTV